MNSISIGTKRLVNQSVQFLNQPIVKENIKNVAGMLTFASGLVGGYDLYQIMRGREISTEVDYNLPRWEATAKYITIFTGKISLVLSAAVSRPGVYLISSFTGCFVSTAQLNRAFGPNTIFAINRKHPRHIASIVAVIFALPTVMQSAYLGANWMYRQAIPHRVSQGNKPQVGIWLTDVKLRCMTLFNTLTSRPVLHIGNLLLRPV